MLFAMKIEVDTHAHTLVSGHAYNTMREMMKMAAEKGLKGLALTEHAPKMPGSTNLYYFQNHKAIPREMYGIRLLFGVELNILNGEGEVDLPDKTIAELDLAIASMHTLCFQEDRSCEAVMKAYKNVMSRRDIDIIGHPDDGRFPVDYEELVKEAKRTGTLLEINNSSLKPGGFRQNSMENTKEMLKLCKKHETMVVLGTDSHVDEAIADYSYVMGLLQETDFPQELIANTSYEKLLSVLKHRS